MKKGQKDAYIIFEWSLIKLGIKPPMHLLEIGIFSLYHVIVRTTKIMNRADKNWASFQKNSFLKVDFLV